MRIRNRAILPFPRGRLHSRRFDSRAVTAGQTNSAWNNTWMGAAPLAVSGAPLLMQVSPIHRRREAFTAQAVMLGIVAFAGSLIAGQLPA